MSRPLIPVWSRLVRKLFTTVATRVESCKLVHWCRRLGRVVLCRWNSSRRVECKIVLAVEGGAGPRVLAEMEGILMAFGFVLVFEAISTVLALILLFRLMMPAISTLYQHKCTTNIIRLQRLTSIALACRTFLASWDSIDISKLVIACLARYPFVDLELFAAFGRCLGLQEVLEGTVVENACFVPMDSSQAR